MFIVDAKGLKLGLILAKCRVRSPDSLTGEGTHLSYISWKISLKRPSYFFIIVFFVDMNCVYYDQHLPILLYLRVILPEAFSWIMPS